jgi:hypothetical protein
MLTQAMACTVLLELELHVQTRSKLGRESCSKIDDFPDRDWGLCSAHYIVVVIVMSRLEAVVDQPVDGPEIEITASLTGNDSLELDESPPSQMSAERIAMISWL